jgi:hypothetical protein
MTDIRADTVIRAHATPAARPDKGNGRPLDA